MPTIVVSTEFCIQKCHGLTPQGVRTLKVSRGPKFELKVCERQKDRPDWTFCFAPNPASWANTVKRFFSKISLRTLKRATFNSLDDLITVIDGCNEHHNTNDAHPFRWSKKTEDLVDAQKKHQKLQDRHREKESHH